MSAREAYRQYREAVTACKDIFARGGNVTGDYGEHLVKQLMVVNYCLTPIKAPM